MTTETVLSDAQCLAIGAFGQSPLKRLDHARAIEQAEAYKDACVREALEGVIQSLEAETAKAREHKAYAAVLALMSQAELIRVQLHKQ